MTDAEDNFYKTYEQDGLGRISKVTIGLQRREMLSYSLTHDSFGHIKTKSAKNHEGRPSEENYSYTKSRQLAKIWGPDNFDYEHDENGNLIKVQGAQGKDYLFNVRQVMEFPDTVYKISDIFGQKTAYQKEILISCKQKEG